MTTVLLGWCGHELYRLVSDTANSQAEVLQSNKNCCPRCALKRGSYFKKGVDKK